MMDILGDPQAPIRISWDATQRILSEHAPELLAECLPRIYEQADGYLTSQQIAVRLASAIFNERMTSAGGYADPTAQLHGIIAQDVVDIGVPTWWVGRHLVESLLATDLPDQVRFSDTPFPFPAFVLVLPSGLIVDSEGCSVSFLQVMAKDAATFRRDYSSHQGADFAARGIFAISTVMDAADRSLMGPIYHTARFLDQSMEEWRRAESAFTGYFGATITLGDEVMVETLARLAISASYLLADRTDLVEGSTDQQIKRIRSSFHGGEKIPLFPTRWLGRTFRPARESAPGSGSHASPRAHWRRGHWRSQAHGEGRRLRRMTWIQPILIGG